jgi:hypothetical protein
MQVIAGFFGSGALAALPVDGAAFSPYFKKLAQFAKLATSYMGEKVDFINVGHHANAELHVPLLRITPV